MHASAILILLLATPCGLAENNGSISDVLNMTVFDGNWRIQGHEGHDQRICEYPGTLYIISKVSVSRGKRIGEPRYRIYIVEYSNCIYDEWDEYGSTLCRGGGCWISIVNRDFMMYDTVWNKRTQNERNIMNNTTRFKGVCARDWHPFYGDPSANHTIQNVKHIWGDPKIRFENASVIDGKTHIRNGSDMIIDTNIWHSIDEIEPYKTCRRCDRWIPYFDSLNVTTATSESSNLVTVDVNAVLKWYYYQRDCCISGDTITCYDLFRNTTERATFTVSAEKPVVIDTSTIENISAQITVYNNTFDPYMTIRVDVPDNITETTFVYKNNTAKHFHKLGWVHDSMVEYLDHPTWKTTPHQTMVCSLGDQCLIRDTPPNTTHLQIQVSTPYTTTNVTKYNITTITSKPTDYIHLKGMFLYISMVGLCVFCIGANLQWRKR